MADNTREVGLHKPLREHIIEKTPTPRLEPWRWLEHHQPVPRLTMSCTTFCANPRASAIPPSTHPKTALTAERARELLSYDQDTGFFTWNVSRGRCAKGDVAGCLNPQGYIQIMVDGLNYTAHRIAWLIVHGNWPNNEIDHLNGLRDDNRLANLRDVTATINQQNIRRARSDNHTGLLGASWNKENKKFVSSIRVSGKRITLGSFPTAEEAHAAYLRAKRELHAGCLL